MKKGRNISVSAPGKIHLLGEHSVVYGKPAILTSVGLRLKVTISQGKTIPPEFIKLQKIIERIIKKELKLKKMPLYSLEISSEIPVGAGLGSSAGVSSAYIGALLSYLRVSWNLERINKLAYEAEKVFNGNPSGGDNSTVVYGGLIWFRKEDPNLKLIHPLPFSIPQKLSRNFILINSGKPKETTKDMVEIVNLKFKIQNLKFKKIFEDQERLVKELLPVLKKGNEKEFVRIIRAGEKNLENLGVVSKFARSIIREIENLGGAAKICGAGGKTDPPAGGSGILLCYHKNKKVVENVAKLYNLPYFKAKLGVEGVKIES